MAGSNFFFLYFQLNGKSDPLELHLLDRVQGVSGVVQLFAFFETKDQYIYIMETPKNCLDLYEYMDENGCPSEKIACKFIYKILKTVIGCYHQGVIHRDIKPENILVNLDNL